MLFPHEKGMHLPYKLQTAVHLTNICGLASWSWAHVQHKLSLLWRERHDWQETGGSLQHILTSKILWSGTCYIIWWELNIWQCLHLRKYPCALSTLHLQQSWEQTASLVRAAWMFMDGYVQILFSNAPVTSKEVDLHLLIIRWWHIESFCTIKYTFN